MKEVDRINLQTRQVNEWNKFTKCTVNANAIEIITLWLDRLQNGQLTDAEELPCAD